MATDGVALEYGVLGSGSTGNALWVGGEAGLLVDCGFSVRTTLARLATLGADPAGIRGIFLTHEHGDHAGGAGRLARRLGVPILATRGTLAALRDSHGVVRVPVTPGTPLDFHGFHLTPFAVDHDAADPVGVRIEAGGRRLGLLTDTGGWDEAVARHLEDLDALVVESNHDPDLLAEGFYPEALKARIRGRRGHLSNDACGQLLARVAGPRTRRVVLGHLSQHNNTPALAVATNRAILHRHGQALPDLLAADPHAPAGPFET